MAQNLGAEPLNDTAVGSWEQLIQRFEYLKYVDRETLTLKVVALVIVFILFMRLLYRFTVIAFPSMDLRRRSYRKKRC